MIMLCILFFYLFNQLFNKMGNQQIKQQPTKVNSEDIVVATLNFSGICLSPFEYHDSTIDKEIMSNTFGQTMKKYKLGEKFSWDVGKIDLKIQKQRYTPIYRKDVCVINNKLINRQVFQQQWDKQFNQCKTILKDYKPTQEQIRQIKLFDWMAYETFLIHAYKLPQKQLIDLQKIKGFDTKPFIEFLETWHSKSYLNNVKKMQTVKLFMETKVIDVLFLQQAQIREDVTWEDMLSKEFNITYQKDSESVIVYRKSLFPVTKANAQKFYNEFNGILNVHKDTAFIKTDNNYLLVSSHLSSKLNICAQQITQLKNAFSKIKNSGPQYEKLDIICGIDANLFVSQQEWKKDLIPVKNVEYYFASTKSTEFTTSKKRTMIQLQTSKANKLVIQAKDQIISTLNMIRSQNPKKPWIGMINGNELSDKVFLPTQIHPFDHYLICTQIDTSKKKK